MADNTLKTRIVLRNDTSENWAAANPVLKKGEAGYETDTQRMKFGDGSTAWSSLSYFNDKAYYDVTFDSTSYADKVAAIDATVTGLKQDGDVAIVKELIADNYYQYTAYVYDLESAGWVAMDGNYSAENIIFKNDITATYSFGKYEPDSSGFVDIPATGKTLADLLQDILAKEKDPTVTAPKASVTLTNSGSKEAGTNVTPAYTTSFSAGSYTYGPATGITVSSWAISDTNGATSTASSGNLTAFQVTDSTSYKITAVATHTAGAIPLTNLGNEVSSLAIAAGTKSATSATITGYRQAFYGSVADKSGEITSDVIRGLSGKSGKAVTKGSTLTASEAVGALRVIIAVPASVSTEFSSIKDVNGLNAETLSAWTKITVAVEGANGYDAIDYTVYYKDNAAANDTANTWTATI